MLSILRAESTQLTRLIIGVLVTVGALVGLPLTLYSLGSSFHSAAIIIACIELVIVVFMFFIDQVRGRPILTRIYGLRVPRDSVLLTGRYDWKIDSDFSLAGGSATKQIIFMSNADPHEMYDTFESSTDELTSGVWTSPDSTFGNVILRKKNRKAMLWTPKENVAPWSLYTHTLQRTGPGKPDSWGPDGFYYLIDIDRPTGTLEVTIECPNDIEFAASTTLSRRRRRRVRQHYLWRIYTSNVRRLAGPQPTVLANQRSISWITKNPRFPSSQIILCVYKGQRDLFQSNRDKEPPLLFEALQRCWRWLGTHSWKHFSRQSA